MVRLILLFVLALPVSAAEPVRNEWKVGDVTREGLVVLPSQPKGAPVIFAFHGHGGNSRNAARSLNMHQHWPEAICVYLQGLPTPGRLTDPEGKKNGWQHSAGDQGDRDLKFFDTVLDSLKKDHQIDEKRIYLTGHSNGGGFTYLLWAKRGDVLAAVAPSAAAGAGRLQNDLKPLPAMHLAGEKDELVKFSWQKATIDIIRKVNGCESEGKPWHDKGTLYPSKSGTPVVTYIHSGTHAFPKEGPELIVAFFKEHKRK